MEEAGTDLFNRFTIFEKLYDGGQQLNIRKYSIGQRDPFFLNKSRFSLNNKHSYILAGAFTRYKYLSGDEYLYCRPVDLTNRICHLTDRARGRKGSHLPYEACIHHSRFPCTLFKNCED